MRCLSLVLFAAWVLVRVRPEVLPFPLKITCPNELGGRLDSNSTVTCQWHASFTVTYEPARGESAAGAGPVCTWTVSRTNRTSSDWRGTLTFTLSKALHKVSVACTTTNCPSPDCSRERFSLVVAEQDIRFFVIDPATRPAHQYEVVQFGWCARLGHKSWTYVFTPLAGGPSVNISHIKNTTIPPVHFPSVPLRTACRSYWNFLLSTRYTQAGRHQASLTYIGSGSAPASTSLEVISAFKHIFTATSRQLGVGDTDLGLSWKSISLAAKSLAVDLVDSRSLGGWSLSLDSHAVKTEFCTPAETPPGSSLIARIYFLPEKGPIASLTGSMTFSGSSIVLTVNTQRIPITLKKPQNTAINYDFSGGFYFSKQESSNSVGHYIIFNWQGLSYLFQLNFTDNVLDKFYVTLNMNWVWDYKSLKDMDLGIKLFNSGPSELFTPIHVVWFIPLQHLLLQCMWSFTLELYDAHKTLLENFAYTYSNGIQDAQTYLPRLSLSFNPNQYMGFVATVNFTKSGQKLAVLTASVGTYATNVQNISIYCEKLPCDFHQLSIQKPDGPMPVITIGKGTENTLYAALEMRCPSADKVTMLWKIYKLSSSTSVPDWTKDLNIPAISPKNECNLLIPRFSLNFGLYLFNVSVTVTTFDDEEFTIYQTDSVIIEIKQQDLQAVIEGGSGRSVGFHDTWQLNGQLSADPDSKDPLDGISFTWYCTKNVSDYVTMKLSKDAACSPSQTGLAWTNPNSPDQNVDPETLEGKKDYYFRLVIAKGNRTAFADQTVKIKPGAAPSLTVECIENCEKNLIPTERFILSGKCIDCLKDTSRPRYEWTLYINGIPEATFDWITYTTTGNLKPYLSIKALTFIDVVDKNCTLLLKVITWTGAPSFFWYNFFVNTPPMNGNCNIQPNDGITFVTFFVVHCSGFSDQHQPLSYIVTAGSRDLGKISSLPNKILGTIVYSGYNPVSLPFYLPVGEASKMYRLPVYVNVYDNLGASSRVDLFAAVKDRSTLNEKVLEDMAALINGPLSPMAVYLETVDYLKASNLIYSVASDLNNDISSVPGGEVFDKKSRLRESLLNITTSIAPVSITAINQIITSISEVTKSSKELNMKTRQLAVGKLTEVGNKLSKLREEILTSVLTEELSSGLLSALSNIMDASLLNVNTSDIAVISSDEINVLKQVLSVLEIVAEIVIYGKVPGGRKTVLESNNWIVHLKEEELWDISSTYLTPPGCKNCFYPTFQSEIQNIPKDSITSSVFYEFKKNPFPWLQNGRDIQTMVTGIQMTAITDKGDTIAINPDVANIISAIETKPTSITVPISLAPVPNRTGIISGEFGFKFDMERATDLWLQLSPTVNIGFNISVHLGYNSGATLPVASYQVPVKVPLTQKRKRNKTFVRKLDPYLLIIPLKSIIHSRPKSLLNITILLLSDYQLSEYTDKLLTITISTYSCIDFDALSNSWNTGNCKVGPLTNDKQMHCVCHFSRSKVVAKSIASSFLKKVHRFFAGKLWVPPNVVDFRKIGLVELQTNLVALSAVLFIFAVYIVLAIWAMKKDRADIVSKDQVVILPDNDPFDNICYLVTIYTGSRCGAGTTADVFLKLVGTFSESRIHLLKHIGYSAFLRGGLDTFLLTTKYELGDLYFLRIWHNNGGTSPGWFLSRVKVENMYTKHVWYFMCRKWLAVDKADGLIDRTFSVTNPDPPLKKKDFFLINNSAKLEDSHLWFSIFTLAMAWPFSRLQRLSCCLAMLLSSLLTSIVLYNLEEGKGDTMERHLRSFIVGVESSLVTVPVQFILIFLFRGTVRRSKPNSYIPYQAYAEFRADQKSIMPNDASFYVSHVQPIGWKEHLHLRYTTEVSSKSAVTSSQTSVSPQLPSPPSVQRRKGNNCVVSESTANILTVEEEESVVTIKAKRNHRSPSSTQTSVGNKNNQNSSSQTSFKNKNNQNNNKMTDVKGSLKKKKQPKPCQKCFTLTRKNQDIIHSWWCIYVGWTVVLIVSAIASFIIILYGLSYGFQTSMDWLLASVISFIQSVLIMQTIQIMALSAVAAYSLKYLHHIPWGHRYKFLEIRVAELAKDSDEMRELHYELVKIRNSKQYRPLQEDEITIIKKRNAIKNKAFIFLKGIVSHFIFLTLVLNLAYSNDNLHVFLYNRAIISQFSSNLSTVDRLDRIYIWVNTVFLPLIHNQDEPTYLSDSWSKIVGLPKMRQVRAKPAVKNCFRTNSFVYETRLGKSHCLQRYGVDEEDRLNYTGFWNSSRDVTQVGFYYEPNTSPWNYYSYGDSYVYETGGYNVYFFPGKDLSDSINMLSHLQQSAWLDEHTWAVIFELTTFNADVSLFCTISVVFEASPVGLIHSRLSVHSFTLMVFDQLDKMEIVTILILFVFLIIYVVDEIYTICQQKLRYIKQLTNVINFGLKSVFCVVVCLQVFKFHLASLLLTFYSLNPNQFTPFHTVSYVDLTLRITIGFLAFFAILKTLRYATFFYSVRLAQRSVYAALPGICSMAVVVAVYFFAYMAFGYLVFGQNEWSHSNLGHSAQTVLSYCVTAFRDTLFVNNRILGGIYLTSFMVVMICIVINLLQAVIISAYHDMKQPVYEEPSDEAEVMAFLVHKVRKILASFGRKKPTKREPEILNSLLYGQPDRERHQTLGLKTKKVNGKKMVYLLI